MSFTFFHLAWRFPVAVFIEILVLLLSLVFSLFLFPFIVLDTREHRRMLLAFLTAMGGSDLHEEFMGDTVGRASCLHPSPENRVRLRQRI